MPEADLALLTDAALEAGRIASRYFRRQSLDIRDKGDGQGPVTEADLAVDAMLRETLTGARPDYGWISEESEDDGSARDAERVFIVDPIDGTRAFIDGQPAFAHSLAVAERGEVTAAVIHLPEMDLTYAARKGGGATCNGGAITASDASLLREAAILAGRFNFDPKHWRDGLVPAFRHHFRPSLAYRMALVAEGRFDGMLTLRPTWEWDVAAGALIVAEAGGAVALPRAGAARFNTPERRLPGLLAGAPRVVCEIQAALHPGEGRREKAVEPGLPTA